jgi:hypothetical protein
MAKKSISKLAAQVPSTDAEVAALIAVTLTAQTDRETLVAAQDEAKRKALEAIESEHHYARDLAAKDVLLARNLELLETWAALNKKTRFAKAKSIDLAGARLGWRLGNWKTALAKKVKLVDVVEFLTSLKERGQKEDASEKAKARASLAAEYIRIKTDLDREAMLRDRADRHTRALLKKAGVLFEQEESFYLQPDREGQQPPTLKAP